MGSSADPMTADHTRPAALGDRRRPDDHAAHLAAQRPATLLHLLRPVLPDDPGPGAVLLPYRIDSRHGDGVPWEIGAAPMTMRRTLQHDSPAALLHLHRPAR